MYGILWHQAREGKKAIDDLDVAEKGAEMQPKPHAGFCGLERSEGIIVVVHC